MSSWLVDKARSVSDPEWISRAATLAQDYLAETRMGGAQTNDDQEPDEVDFAVYILHRRGFEHGKLSLDGSVK